MLASNADADDAVQETLIRAWKAGDRFDGRSSVRTWLMSIATNVCIDALTDRSRRTRPVDEGAFGTPDDDLDTRPRTHWCEPVPDARAVPSDADPAEQLALRQSIRLAFVAALQNLPPKQRAALLLAEVMGWSAVEIADTLELTVASVNSALQRARATLGARRSDGEVSPAELDRAQAELVDRYVVAFERFDVDALTSLLREDATLSMPPFTLWLRGPDAIRAWLRGRGSGCEGSRLLRVAANGQPAFAQYRAAPEGGWKPWALIVLELAGDRVASITSFLDVETLFPLFGVPPALPPAA